MSNVLTQILDAAPRCVVGCGDRAVRSGYCERCAEEIEREIDLADAAPTFVMYGRIYYAGQPLPDRF